MVMHNDSCPAAVGGPCRRDTFGEMHFFSVVLLTDRSNEWWNRHKCQYENGCLWDLLCPFMANSWRFREQNQVYLWLHNSDKKNAYAYFCLCAYTKLYRVLFIWFLDFGTLAHSTHWLDFTAPLMTDLISNKVKQPR